jgi:LysR family transcriptional regulator for metE and metH
MEIEIRHLQLVSVVADEGTLTAAGDRLHLTQSALSHQLLDLEERLRTPLFRRISRKMVLTEAGERVLEAARRILPEVERTEADLRELAGFRAGSLRISTECYTCYHWLPGVLREFRARHEGIDVKIDLESTRKPVEALLAGEIDLALVSERDDDDRIGNRILFEDEMLVIVSPRHRFARQSHVKASELAQETLLTYMELEENTAYQRILRPAGLEPADHMIVPLTEAAVELIRAEMGVAVMPRWSIAPQLESGVVAGVRLTAHGLHREWRAAFLKNPRPAPYLFDFIALLAEAGRGIVAGASVCELPGAVAGSR